MYVLLHDYLSNLMVSELIDKCMVSFRSLFLQMHRRSCNVGSSFCSYFDSNNISGTLTFPYISTTSSLVRLISLTNNNITDLQPSTVSPSLFTEESLRISDLVFLGGNPICKDARKSDLLRIVCRFNKSSPIEGRPLKLLDVEITFHTHTYIFIVLSIFSSYSELRSFI